MTTDPSSSHGQHKANLMAAAFLFRLVMWPGFLAQDTWLSPELACITMVWLTLRGGNEKLCSGETIRDSHPFEPPPEEPASLIQGGPRLRVLQHLLTLTLLNQVNAWSCCVSVNFKEANTGKMSHLLCFNTV